MHPFVPKNEHFSQKSATFCKWPKRINFGESTAKSRKRSPTLEKSNVSASRDCLVRDALDSYQRLRIRATRRLVWPISKWALHQFASDGLVFLEKIWRFPTQANLEAKIFRPQTFMILWYNFSFQTLFLKHVNHVWAATNLCISRCGTVA